MFFFLYPTSRGRSVWESGPWPFFKGDELPNTHTALPKNPLPTLYSLLLTTTSPRSPFDSLPHSSSTTEVTSQGLHARYSSFSFSLFFSISVSLSRFSACRSSRATFHCSKSLFTPASSFPRAIPSPAGSQVASQDAILSSNSSGHRRLAQRRCNGP